MPRKVRSDKQVGNLEKDLGLPAGTVRNRDGRDTRSDKKGTKKIAGAVGSFREEKPIIQN